ncbi:MAG: peptidoglycan bridge formation glycyltransferase FemA/FemB family protein [Anaerolineae bacterium]
MTPTLRLQETTPLIQETPQLFDHPGDQAGWDALVAAAPQGHLLQSWAWGELKARFGWRVQRVAVDGACAQVLFRRLPAGLGSIAYVPKGPLLDFADGPAAGRLLEAIRSLALARRAICLKIEPNLLDDEALAQRLAALGFQPSLQTVQPRRTILVDLEAEPDDVLARMKQKTRYNVRLAARRGVEVRTGGVDDVPAFYALMQHTARRDGFSIHSRAYYEAAHRLLVEPGLGRLLLAEHEGTLLAALVVMAFGREACYMYGASADEGRNLMPTYLLQWESMLWAKEQGCQVYDLWGVPDEDEETLEAGFPERSDGLWGVYRFKRGFGGYLARTAGAWDLVYAPLRYRLYQAAVAFYNRRQGD